ncbi:vacuolar protein sorting/targeting protein 10 [Sporobolomyces salmoneus]|uniref:vacuolar protein sorting/targeting protein 10 n=1 Tax=Sporobolomyces salmoneus TaxID=183962 RepID=UPI003179F203
MGTSPPPLLPRPPSLTPTRMLYLFSLVLTLLSISTSIHAAPEGQKPDLSHTLFDNLPTRIMYFEDSPVVLYHDQIGRNVLRSPDEGKKWDHINGVPKGESIMLIEHPYDNSIAFILTASTTHYRTMNKGETWSSFRTALPPALSANTLGFNAKKWDWILYTGQKCESMGGWGGKICHDETFYTQDAFASDPKLLLSFTTRCIFAHDKKEFVGSSSVPDSLVYCAAFEPPSTSSSSSSLEDAVKSLLSAPRSLKESRLYSSTDFFERENNFVDLGIGKEARGIVGIGGVQKYLVTALKPSSSAQNGGGSTSGGGEMILYVSENGVDWSRAQFPHGHGLTENAYTIVESTSHSLLIDVNSSPTSSSGTLFTSNSNGTYFVRSLENTNRNKMGIVDFEKVLGVEGVAVINTVENVDGVEAGQDKELKTRITFDDGGRWNLIKAPAMDNEGRKIKCDVEDLESCSLHLHSVTQPHNYGRVFSSTAPGLLMGVGSIGAHLLPYDECDTFLSIDNGMSWRMVDDGANKYEFGDQGSVLVMVEDEEPTDEVKYSFDMGKTWFEFDLGVKLRARLLTTVPDSTSLKFLLLGTLTRRSDKKGSAGERHIVVHMDFESLKKRKCNAGDMEKWYARKIGKNGEADCLMGHKQWFMRRKPDADCVVANKWNDPVGTEENCPCDDEDYECDYNFAPDGMGNCIPVGPETIPAGQCRNDGDEFLGSSGFRLIPGNTCDRQRGIKKDEKKMKPCHAGKENPGLVSHQSFTFPGLVLDQSYFGDSHTILAFTSKNRVWQSTNEGFSWNEAVPNTHVMALTMHTYARDRAFLITDSQQVHFTTDKGQNWRTFKAPADPNGFGIPLLDFHPLREDWLIWTGQEGCGGSDESSCRAVAWYTKNNGRDWYKIEEYVRVCSWARDKKLKLDEKIIFCESYRDKKGSQRAVYANNNPLQLVEGDYFYSNKKTVFHSIVGFATFEEYMVVAEMAENSRAIGLEVSLDGKNFALARFPPNMQLENQAYTVLESTTDSVFLHVTTHPNIGSEWGTLFKSNSNGTYYSPSLEYVNRNGKGFVDFEKMIGLDGIAVINVVSNPEEAALSSNKKLQSRITHNDGGRWKPMNPPAKDALGRTYDCTSARCTLHIHGYTERRDPRATYSSPSAVGLMLAVGNVGEHLLPYTDSDTFLTRDGGFTWEEVHKDAHVWEYGDQGSILLLANDEDATDHATYSLNEGLSWQDYNFGERIRVKSIVTVPMDTSRKFILFGTAPDRPEATVAIHLDFSSVTNVKCKLDLAHPDRDDFELWTPSESRDEPCLFGMQTYYHRRVRDRSCFVGERLPQPAKIEKHCPCSRQDFECEFNYRLDDKNECVLVPGARPLEADQTCTWDQPFWYDRTPYRKIPHSQCEGGLALDRGSAHVCPGNKTRSGFFWTTIAVLPFGIAALAAVWWTRRRGGSGRIRLPEPGEGNRSGLAELVISIPWFVIGVFGAVAAWAKDVEIPFLSDRLRRRNSRNHYRTVRLDDSLDAELLGDYDDEL